jgi:DNA-binding transcriptional LysR family regulator
LPEILARFRRLYPRIDLNMEVANTHVIQKYLNDRRVDIAVTEGFVHLPQLQARMFLRDDPVLYDQDRSRRPEVHKEQAVAAGAQTNDDVQNASK